MVKMNIVELLSSLNSTNYVLLIRGKKEKDQLIIGKKGIAVCIRGFLSTQENLLQDH